MKSLLKNLARVGFHPLIKHCSATVVILFNYLRKMSHLLMKLTLHKAYPFHGVWLNKTDADLCGGIQWDFLCDYLMILNVNWWILIDDQSASVITEITQQTHRHLHIPTYNIRKCWNIGWEINLYINWKGLFTLCVLFWLPLRFFSWKNGLQKSQWRCFVHHGDVTNE